MKQKICQKVGKARGSKGKSHGKTQSRCFSYSSCYLFSLAQVSFRLTVRLNTRLPGLAVIINTEVPDPLELEFFERLRPMPVMVQPCIR